MENRNSEDMINHPSHYAGVHVYVECNDIKHWMPSGLGDSFKYVWRAGYKDSEEEDLKKARWYINDMLTIQSLSDNGVLKDKAYPFRVVATTLMELLDSSVPIPEGPNERLRRNTLRVLAQGELIKASNYIRDWLGKLQGDFVNKPTYAAIMEALNVARDRHVKMCGQLPSKKVIMSMMLHDTGFSAEQIECVLQASNFALKEEVADEAN